MVVQQLEQSPQTFHHLKIHSAFPKTSTFHSSLPKRALLRGKTQQITQNPEW